MRTGWTAWVRWVRAAALALAVAPAFASAQAPERVTIGALRFSSSGPVFLALDRGYFREAGLDAAVAFFQAAGLASRNARIVSTSRDWQP